MSDLDNPTAFQSIVDDPEQAEAMLEDLHGLEEMEDIEGWELKLMFKEEDLDIIRDELRELANAGGD